MNATYDNYVKARERKRERGQRRAEVACLRAAVAVLERHGITATPDSIYVSEVFWWLENEPMPKDIEPFTVSVTLAGEEYPVTREDIERAWQ